MWCGGIGGIVSGDAPMSIWRAAPLICPLEKQWNTLQWCCAWSMFMSVCADNGGWCYTTQEMGLARREMRGTQQPSLTFMIIKTCWHGEEKNVFSASVYSSIWLLWVQEKVGWSHLGVWNSGGTVRENALCWCFCLTWAVANSYCKPGVLPRLTGVIWDLAAFHTKRIQRPWGSYGRVTLLQVARKGGGGLGGSFDVGGGNMMDHQAENIRNSFTIICKIIDDSIALREVKRIVGH